MPSAVVRRAAQAVAIAPVQVEASVTVQRSATDLYSFWRKLSNLPRFMRHLESVVESGDRRSHWVGRGPLGLKVEWDAEVVEERPGQLLSWWSLPESQIHNAGSVLFTPATGGRGTVVRVAMELEPRIGKAIGRMLSALTVQQVREDLRRFKNLMEAGEVPISRRSMTR